MMLLKPPQQVKLSLFQPLLTTRENKYKRIVPTGLLMEVSKCQSCHFF